MGGRTGVGEKLQKSRGGFLLLLVPSNDSILLEKAKVGLSFWPLQHKGLPSSRQRREGWGSLLLCLLPACMTLFQTTVANTPSLLCSFSGLLEPCLSPSGVPIMPRLFHRHVNVPCLPNQPVYFWRARDLAQMAERLPRDCVAEFSWGDTKHSYTPTILPRKGA